MPPDDDEEFWSWFDSLSPEEQQYFAYESQLGTANQVPYSFGSMAPQLDPGAFDLSSFNGGAAIPELRTNGNVDPYDLSQAAKRFNLMQDYGTGTVDNALAMFAGPGAYDIGAFQDTVIMPTDRANDSGARMLQQYAQGGGYEGYMAQKILEGATPSQAYAELMDLVNTQPDESTPPEAIAQRDALIASLPVAVREGPTMPGDDSSPYDQKAILNFGNELFQTTFQDDQPVWTDPQTGIGYMSEPQVEPSKAAAWYRDRGLPLPTERYDDPKYLEATGLSMGMDQEYAQWEQEVAAADRALQHAEANSREGQRRVDVQNEGLTQFARQLADPAMAAGRSRELWNNGLRARPQGATPTFVQRPEGASPQAEGFLENVASRFRRVAPADRPMVNRDTGNVSMTLGGIQRNPDGPFDFGVALANPKRNEPVTGQTRQRARRVAQGQDQRLRSARSQRNQAINALSDNQRGAAQAVGAQLGLAQQGRSPLQDALLQRLLSQGAMGGR